MSKTNQTGELVESLTQELIPKIYDTIYDCGGYCKIDYRDEVYSISGLVYASATIKYTGDNITTPRESVLSNIQISVVISKATRLMPETEEEVNISKIGLSAITKALEENIKTELS